MFSLLNSLAVSFLLSTGIPANPTTPEALPFEASAFVTNSNQIRVAVQKKTDVPVVVLLRSTDNQVLFRHTISKKKAAYAVKLDVAELADGQYELEVKSETGSIRKQLNLSTAPVQQTTRVVAMR